MSYLNITRLFLEKKKKNHITISKTEKQHVIEEFQKWQNKKSKDQKS